MLMITNLFHMIQGIDMKATLEQVVNELKVHQRLDHYVQGTYDTNAGGEFRGCSIGCAVESLCRLEGRPFETGNAPKELERIGVPQTLSRMIEFVFERLPYAEAVQYSIDAHEAMIGKTKLDDVMRQQHIWMLERLNSPHCNRVLYLLKNNGTQDEFREAAKAAKDAADAADAIEVAMASGAACAAVAEAKAAWAAARAAAWSEAWAAIAAIKAEAAMTTMEAKTANASYKNFVTVYADNLLKLINEAS
jgi:hypothetical protein